MADALAQLDRVRNEAVDRARTSLAEARHQHEAAQRSLSAQRAELVRCERERGRAFEAFAGADSVLQLRAGELQLASVESACRRAAARVALLEQQCEASVQRLRSSEHALRTAEVDRRAVERKLAQRAADVGRRTEREREAEAEDAFRSTRAR